MGGSASKVDFTQRMTRLVTEGIEDEGADFWMPVFLTEATLEEVHALMKNEDIKRVRREHPQNIALLLFQCVEQLKHFLELSDAQKTSDWRSASNSLKILTRLMPVLHEEPEEGCMDIIYELFWENRRCHPKNPQSMFSKIAGYPLGKPIGEVLMETLVAISNTTNFCVSSNLRSLQPEDYIPEGYNPYSVWYSGVGKYKTAADVPTTPALDKNRLDTVLCMLACCTGPMFRKDPLQEDKFISVLVTSKQAPSLVISLINSVVQYDPSGSLPYSSYMTDLREPLMSSSLDLLLVCLDAGYLCRAFEAMGGEMPPHGYAAAATTSHNLFWKTISTISEPADLSYLFKGVCRLVRNPMDASSTWLPGSQKSIANGHQILGLICKLLDCNVPLRQFVARDVNPQELLVPVLHIMWKGKTSKSPHEYEATMYVAIWILTTLSSERDFAIKLNTPVTEMPNIPLPVFSGTYIDLIVVVFQQLIQSGIDWIRRSAGSLICIIVNISPYAKSLSMVGSVKLLNLYEIMSTQKYISASSENWRPLALLTQTLNNLIQYQYEGNTPLLYGILRRHEIFRKVQQMLSPEGVFHEESWVKHVDVNSVLMRVIDTLLDDVTKFCEKGTVTEPEIIAHLQTTTLVGLLPQPHVIQVHSNQPSPAQYSYFAIWIWSLIYNTYQRPAMFNPSAIRLFPVYAVGTDGALTPIEKAGEANGAVEDTKDTSDTPPPTDPMLQKKLDELQELKNQQSDIQKQILEQQAQIQKTIKEKGGSPLPL
eukprot:TRINITY_DN1534_c1_g1_i2.p1 TRINITY_DN1534_c1_g1~~TRINITY_DN1534_c1_g1_i2.p1  ORF type:complete len:765 (+),score=123.96 TRINITY_DN1534_c1_g1_i2:52-2346(+)